LEVSITTTQAVDFLMAEQNLTQKAARALIKAGEGAVWKRREGPGSGGPKLLCPVSWEEGATENPKSATPPESRAGAPPFSVDRMDTGQPKITHPEPAPDAAIPNQGSRLTAPIVEVEEELL
jgi:hypothetical protein